MKKLFSLLLGACTVLAACTDDVENIRQDGSTKIAVNVKVNPTSRAMVHGTALPGGSSIGINVTDATGNPYDGKDAGYLNIQYTATGEAGAQEWGATTPVLLSGTEGKMYAYYPWTTGIDYKAVAVDVADQIDWMYAADTYTVSDAKNAHEIVLSHAQTAVNVNLVRDASYTGVGLVEALTVTSEGLASTASLDTRDGSFASVTGANTAISIIEAPYTLDGTILSSQENPYMLIPASTETKDFTVSATLDGKSYSHKVTMAEAFASGKVYKINVTFKNTGLEVSTVTLVDWVETGLGDAEFKPQVPVLSWETLTNGIYAVAADGSPVMADDADETCVAVALIVNDAPVPQRLMIEKNEYLNNSYKKAYEGAGGEYDGSSVGYRYFHMGGYGINLDGITDYEKVQTLGYMNTYGYLPDENGNYKFSDDYFHIDGNYKNWSGESSLADFNGKENTAAIQTVTTLGGGTLLYTYASSLLKTFNHVDNDENLGYTDWYIPATGQLSLIYMNLASIENVLSKINGFAFDRNSYWTSTEKNAEKIWQISFGNGYLTVEDKSYSSRIRFIRNL